MPSACRRVLALAERVLELIAPMVLRDGTPLDQARLLRVQGVAANGQNNFVEAIVLLGRAELAFQALHNRLEGATCWFEQAWVALRQAQADQAAFFRAAAPLVAAHPYDAWRANYGHAAIRRGEASAALRRYRTASRIVATLRRRLASEEISTGLYTQAAQLHADRAWVGGVIRVGDTPWSAAGYERILCVCSCGITLRCATTQIEPRRTHETSYANHHRTW